MIRNQTFEELFPAVHSVLSHYLQVLEAQLFIVDEESIIWMRRNQKRKILPGPTGIMGECVKKRTTWVCTLDELEEQYDPQIDLTLRSIDECLVSIPITHQPIKEEQEDVVGVLQLLTRNEDAMLELDSTKYFLEIFCVILTDIIHKCRDNEILTHKL